MSFISAHFEALLSTRTDKTSQDVLSQLETYSEFIEKYLLGSINNHLHFIGMVNRSTLQENKFNRKPDKYSKIIYESQFKVWDTLSQVKPDIVGIHGFCGNNYSYDKAILEYGQMFEYNPKKLSTLLENASATQHTISFNKSDGVVSYFSSQPGGCYFIGLEEMDLYKLSVLIDIEIDKLDEDTILFEKPPILELKTYVNRLRSYLLIAKASCKIKYTKQAKHAALVITFDQIQEITGLNNILPATLWRFYYTLPAQKITAINTI